MKYAKFIRVAIVASIILTVFSCRQYGSERLSQPKLKVSKAHQLSAYAIIDPTYSTTRLVPEPDVIEGAPWLYGPVELESWKLQLLRVSSKAVAHHGHYPGVYHVPSNRVSFSCVIFPDSKLSGVFELLTNADVEVIYHDKIIYESNKSEQAHFVHIPEIPPVPGVLVVRLETSEEPPGMLIREGAFSTENPEWEWQDGDNNWSPAARYPQTRSGVMPHNAVMQEFIVDPVDREGILYDFGRALIGYITFKSSGEPSIIVGESITEAMDTVVSHHEQTLTLINKGSGIWESEYPLAFRYLQILDGNAKDVKCRAQFWPVQYKGAFACSDSLLTKIWMVSAYTHRINSYEFNLDGIKRDRLPWIDNMKLGSAVESYTFSDPELLRRTISVLGRASNKSSVNNIVDYDALWVISQDAFQLYFDDPEFLLQEWPRIYDMIERKSAICDENGLLSWPSGSWLFIDWVAFDRYMSQQVMWYWAQKAAIRLASRVGDEDAVQIWTERVTIFEKYLENKAWDKEKLAWTDPIKSAEPTRHANLLSMVSGLSKPEHYEGVMNLLRDTVAEPLNSPSMYTYYLRTLIALGERKEALDKVREIWGSMLSYGSTTFWEGYNPSETGDDIYRFYGRPYGKSMAHGWSAGPVFLLPEIIFGLEPVEDGWKTFKVDPAPGLLKWANATVPTKYGTIELEIIDKKLKLKIPGGTAAIWKGKLFEGPRVLEESLQ